MKNTIKGFVIGSILTLAGTIGIAFALDSNKPNQLQTHLIGQINEIVNSQCDVYVGYGRTTLSKKCFRGEVMTGFDNDRIYCADIEVECFQKK